MAWMQQRARSAGVVDPTSPYLEEIAGKPGNGPPLKLTVLGDSTAIGTGTTSRNQTFAYDFIEQSLLPTASSVKYINRAVSGAKIGEVVGEQLKGALTDNPDLVLISIGANDATAFTSSEAFRESLKILVNRLLKETGAKIILLGIPAIYPAPLLLPLFPGLVDFSTRALQKAEDLELVQYSPERVLKVDIYNTTGPLFASHPEYFAADGYHPNEKGYKVWAAEISKLFTPWFKPQAVRPNQ